MNKTGSGPIETMLHFAAGTYTGLRERPQTGDLVLAADAGYLACRQAGITRICCGRL